MSTLKIYRAPAGHWSGIIVNDDGEEIGRIAGCDSPDDVEIEAYNVGEQIDVIERVEHQKPKGG